MSMGKLFFVGLVSAASLLLSACSGKTADATKDAPAVAAPASEAVRSATYDPNVKPTSIVWDNPEKQRKWEAAQAQQAAASKATSAP